MTVQKATKGSAHIFLSQVSILGLRTILTFVLARILGPGGYGQFSVVFSVLIMAQIPIGSGLTASITKEVAANPDKAYSIIRFGYFAEAIWSTLVFLTVYLSSDFIAQVIFKDPTLATTLKIAMLSLIPAGIFSMGLAILLGRGLFKKTAIYQFIWFSGLARPLSADSYHILEILLPYLTEGWLNSPLVSRIRSCHFGASYKRFPTPLRF